MSACEKIRTKEQVSQIDINASLDMSWTDGERRLLTLDQFDLITISWPPALPSVMGLLIDRNFVLSRICAHYASHQRVIFSECLAAHYVTTNVSTPSDPCKE